MMLLATVLDDREESIYRAKAMLSSAHRAGWNGKYLILFCGKNLAELKTFEKKGISTQRVSSPFVEDDEWFKRTTWNKFYLFGEEYEKPILYLDADVLVYDTLDWVEDISDFAAIRSHHAEDLSERIHNCTLEECLLPGLPIDYNAPQFNAGVFVIGKDTDISLNELTRTTRKIREYCKLRDQSVLNYLLPDYVKLPQKYNYGADVILNKLNHGTLNDDDYSIIHFSGNHSGSFTKEFRRFYDQFDEIDFTKSAKGKRTVINREGKECVKEIRHSLYAMFGRAWTYIYDYDVDFRKRNPDPNKIPSGEKIKVPGWFNSIQE